MYPAYPHRVRLNRRQQLTLTTWRVALEKVRGTLNPAAILEHAALHAVLASLRDIDEPLALLARHPVAHAEVALVASLVRNDHDPDLHCDIAYAAFMLRWNELVADTSLARERPLI